MLKKPEPEKDDQGYNIITKRFLRKLCEYDELFETPGLTKHLYLHYQSFTEIRNLEDYTNLRVLWLENNMISEIKNLESLSKLRCLYLQHNCLTQIKNLDNLKDLSTLNLSFNQISKIENLSNLLQLEDLNISHNSINNSSSIVPISEVPSLKVLDLRSNSVEDSEFLLDSLKTLKNLKSLYLKGNPCLEDIKFYRKSFIGNLKNLVYFDDKPVSDIERIAADAWVEGGEEGEKEAKNAFRNRVKEQKNQEKDGLKDVLLRYEKKKKKFDEIRDFHRHSAAFERKKKMMNQFHKIESVLKDWTVKKGISLTFPFESENINLRELFELKFERLEELLIENEFDFEKVNEKLKPNFNCTAETLRVLWSDFSEENQNP
jgi:dynein assembly factor 1